LYGFFYIKSFSHAALGYLVVLAKGTAKVAACYKDCARAIVYGDGWLFSKVKTGNGNAELVCFFAKAGFALGSVYFAVSWAKGAGFVGVHSVSFFF
jgi:hypothetical protein